MAGIARKSWAQRFPFSRFRSTLGCSAFSRALLARLFRSTEREKRSEQRRRRSSRGWDRAPALAAGPVRVKAESSRRSSSVSAGARPRLPARDASLGRDSANGKRNRRKLEDLVRLALKRLNVSYLTISSRLVWFERETSVYRAAADDEAFAIRLSSRSANHQI